MHGLFVLLFFPSTQLSHFSQHHFTRLHPPMAPTRIYVVRQRTTNDEGFDDETVLGAFTSLAVANSRAYAHVTKERASWRTIDITFTLPSRAKASLELARSKLTSKMFRTTVLNVGQGEDGEQTVVEVDEMLLDPTEAEASRWESSGRRTRQLAMSWADQDDEQDAMEGIDGFVEEDQDVQSEEEDAGDAETNSDDEVEIVEVVRNPRGWIGVKSMF